MTTIREVLSILREPLHSLEPIDHSVDILKFGHLDTRVKGIVVTFIATIHVIEQAIALGANLIITHEGIFYSHRDEYEFSMEQNPVFQAKKRLIEDSGMAVYRFHDHIHKYRPDGITEGLVSALGWQAYVTEQLTVATLITLPEVMTGLQIAEYLKRQLNIAYLRSTGDLSKECKHIGLLAGYRGGGPLTIPLFEHNHLDLILYGEGPEWETPEYVRDATHLGNTKALIVLGHAESEQPGMRLLTERLGHKLPETSVHYIPVAPVFQII